MNFSHVQVACIPNLYNCLNVYDLKSKIISRRSKLQIYKTLIRAVVTYGAETWTLTAEEENALRRFERKVLRKIY